MPSGQLLGMPAGHESVNTYYRRQSIGVSISADPVFDFTAGLLCPHKIDGHYVRISDPAFIEFGFKIPVLARSDGEVVDGHLRIKAARKLKQVE